MIVNQDRCIFNVEMVDGDHVLDVLVCIDRLFRSKFDSFPSISLANGCLEPLPDTIENGWKSMESYIIQSDAKYYLLTRYSCHGNALLVDSSARVIDIHCQNSQWQFQTLPACQLPESDNTKI